MTPRERMRATLAHRQPDRVPMALYARTEVQQALVRHYGVSRFEEVLELLDADMFRGAGATVRRESFERRAVGELSGAFGSTGKVIVHDERTYEDRFGVIHRIGTDGKYIEWAGGPFSASDDLDAFDWPLAAEVEVPADLASRAQAYRDQGYWVVGSGGPHPFKQSWNMRGFENFLCDYIANPAFVEAMYARLLPLNVSCCRAAAAAGCDMVMYWGDVAMQDRMIVPPERWRDLDKPVWAEIIRAAREVKPDLAFFFHSDGDISPIVDDLIEIGFDIINPIQPECVDPARFKQRWGERCTMFGGGSVQRTLPSGTLDDVRREVEYLLTCCAYNGGYVLEASNMISFDCPVENVATFFETGRDFDLSQLSGPPETIPDHPPCMDVPVGGYRD